MSRLKPTDPCWCGCGEEYRKCHFDFDKKIETFRKKHVKVPNHKLIKTPAQIDAIKKSAEVNIAVLDKVSEVICEGMSTEEINEVVHSETIKRGAIPAPLNYNGFPKSVCTSVNDVVCHGIPSKDEILKNGDIINVDCSTILDGYFSDSSRMFMIGDVSYERKKLVEVTKECVELGIKAVKPWHFLGDVADVINKHAKANKFSVVREIGGHGVGLEFHEDPFVSYVIRKGTGMLMVPGMMFTIEPMVNEGFPDVFTDIENGWTVMTKDRRDSAQWEVQVLVTEDGCEIISY